MTWKWTIKEAFTNYKIAEAEHFRAFNLLTKSLSVNHVDLDVITWNGKSQTIREAYKAIDNEFVFRSKEILRQLSWEDQITFVATYRESQPYLFYFLDDVQRTAMRIVS